MQPANESNSTCPSTLKCNSTVILLLFVGFIIGFSVGFVTKDTIVSSAVSWMGKPHQPIVEIIEHPATPPEEAVEGHSDGAQPTKDEDEKTVSPAETQL